MLWTLVHKRFKTRPAFLPPPLNHVFCFIARLRRRRSANGTQQHNNTLPNGGGQVTLTICRRTVRVIPLEKMGAKNFYICSVFRQPRDLMANVCWLKRDIDNGARALESTKDLLRCRKISWTLAHKRLRIGPEILPTLTISFCHSPSHNPYAALTWRRTATLDETTLGSSAAQIWSPKMISWKCYRVGWPWVAIHRYNCHIF